MRRRVLSAASVIWLVVLAVLLSGHCAFAQSVSPAPIGIAPSSTADIGDILHQGRQMELDRRWGDALSHYEDAIRQFPTHDDLHQRFEFTRLHYDLGRRYTDHSFCNTLDRLSEQEALDLYREVLVKIQAHYVEGPAWQELVQHGTNALEVALTEPVFLQRNAPRAAERQILEFRDALHRMLNSRTIECRDDARDTAAAAARLAKQLMAVAPAAVVLEYTCGAANSLDCYSAYLTPDQLSDVYSQIEGNFVGLGIELKSEPGALVIVRVIPRSPAQLSGVRAGDRIVAVDGQPTCSLSADEAANLLQGEANTIARLSLVSPGQDARQVDVRRKRVEVPSIDETKIIDPDYGIGYFKLSCFQKTTCRDLDAAMWKLHREGMKALVIDLRGNPGGLLITAVEVVDKFVDRGIIVSTRGRSLQEDFTYSAHATGTWRVPLVVLIDHESASAAEIFAGAIRDHRRGTLVGRRSYGKGSVQGIFPLNHSSAGIRLTTAKFYSPSGRPFSLVGVEPDVLVHRVARPIVTLSSSPAMPKDDDQMLAAALHAARQLTAKR